MRCSDMIDIRTGNWHCTDNRPNKRRVSDYKYLCSSYPVHNRLCIPPFCLHKNFRISQPIRSLYELITASPPDGEEVGFTYRQSGLARSLLSIVLAAITSKKRLFNFILFEFASSALNMFYIIDSRMRICHMD